MTTSRPYVLAESTWKQVDPTPYSVAVLPWGATEAHNYHLPYATDNIQAEQVAIRAAANAWTRGARVVVLPTIPFGVNTTQLDIKLTINVNPSTQLALLNDIVWSLEGQGVHKLVIVNGHGGNDFRQMIRELQPKTRVFLSTINWWSCVDVGSFVEEPG
ncbi:MAG TPA: creatininase family protein, partial [Gemmatimonadaceae bacterium]|nr:creatininase family protein [Gemmatimonadaceae bacterium]